MNIASALAARVSAHHFDADAKLENSDIAFLVESAQQAPSAYNLQHTRFIAITDTEAKAALHTIAYRQDKVLAAAVTLIVLADLEAYRSLPDIHATAIAAGTLDMDKAAAEALRITRTYSDNTTLARDEGIRSASLAAMALMLAATSRGWSSCPMTGFDSAKLRDIFRISPRYLPVMLVAIGPATNDTSTRKPRLPLSTVLAHDVRAGEQHPFSDPSMTTAWTIAV